MKIKKLFFPFQVTTRLLAGTAGVRIPRSIALISQPPDGVLRTHRHPDVTVLDASELVAQMLQEPELVRRQLEQWIFPQLERWPAWIKRVIVKPSGLMHLQGRGVQILPRDDLTAIVDAGATVPMMNPTTGASYEVILGSANDTAYEIANGDPIEDMGEK